MERLDERLRGTFDVICGGSNVYETYRCLEPHTIKRTPQTDSEALRCQKLHIFKDMVREVSERFRVGQTYGSASPVASSISVVYYPS